MARSGAFATGGGDAWRSEHNPECPDHAAHSENAFDRLHPDRRSMNGMSTDEMEAVDREAHNEYMNCEGHG